MQFLSENPLNMSNFWTVWFLETESEQNFGFPHIPTEHILSPNYSVNNRTTAVFELDLHFDLNYTHWLAV